MLLAGEGSRLRPYTNDLPKCLVPLDGEALLERQLKLFKSSGITDIHLVTGYQQEKLAAQGYPTYLNADYGQSNMVYSLYCAMEILRTAESVVISYGDILYDATVLEKVLASTSPVSVVADKEWASYWRARMEDVAEDAESFITSPEGTILELGGTIETIESVEAQYIGLVKFEKEGLTRLVEVLTYLFETDPVRYEASKNMCFTDLLQSLIDQGVAIHPVYIEGSWLEIDTVEDYERLVGSGYSREKSVQKNREQLIKKYGE